MKMQTSATNAIARLMTVLFIGLNATAGGADYRLVVRGAKVALNQSPIVTEIAAPLPLGTYRLESAGQAALPAQVFEHHGKRFLAVILGRAPAGGDVTYRLRGSGPGDFPAAQGVSIRRHGPNLRVDLDRRLLTEYRVDVGHKPVFFPLVGPTGESYTRAYPVEKISAEDDDHPHQQSCWLTHGKVNGIDFWSESAQAGTIKETDRAIVAEGPVLAQLWTKNDWLAPGGKKVLADERKVTFYRTMAARILDFDFTFQADSGPVSFGETKEGMFGLRVASSMDVTKKTGGKITSSEGLTDEAVWGQAAAWVDYTGPVGGRTVGIAVLNHPDSFRYPTNWHVRPYGLFAANPFGGHDFKKPDRGEYTLPAGQSLRFRYRVILHEGTTGQAALPAQFLAYSKPPRLEVTAH